MIVEHDIFGAVPTTGQVVAQAARSVALLHVIESTVTRLTSNSEIVRSMTREVGPLLDRLDSYDGSELLDPEGRACELLKQAADTAARLHARAVRARQAAIDDQRLKDEDGVVESWTDHIEALSDYHNAIEDLRDRVETLDALKSPRGEVFTDVEALIASLGA